MVHSEAGRRIALRIEIDHQHSEAEFGQTGAHIDSRRRFFRRHPFGWRSPRSWGVGSMLEQRLNPRPAHPVSRLEPPRDAPHRARRQLRRTSRRNSSHPSCGAADAKRGSMRRKESWVAAQNLLRRHRPRSVPRLKLFHVEPSELRQIAAARTFPRGTPALAPRLSAGTRDGVTRGGASSASRFASGTADLCRAAWGSSRAWRLGHREESRGRIPTSPIPRNPSVGQTIRDRAVR